ncbi:hypothetical protein [Lysinibacter sp. HNR]|uniref:trypsin-like serine peptidase n=1 Tax=Lysinibacter sp. HNR TaxID=3031408 RepID=UPI002434FA8E|nr:hypothetical protein [Lysinibacter sp. HNR]WGD36919.1 hypothetical protein FrondiHNR_10755 [Lysinibacter sp. HNR]
MNSLSKRLVATAAHCVHGGAGRDWHENWAFFPGYQGPGTGDDTAPYGVYNGVSALIFEEWLKMEEGASRLTHYDVAFMTTHLNPHGSRLVDEVGGHGLWNGGSYPFNATVFGYPQKLDNGNRMRVCKKGTYLTWSFLAYFYPTVYCKGFGLGASGSPFLHKYDPSTGLGYIRSVLSAGPESDLDISYGVFFDSRVVDDLLGGPVNP